ncbi:hypothetical protein, variant [Aphanomyces invadans]|uniref:SH2 domain-containing protein n=1 Tax=Aphanomyces invadans TaxID=157072 RepID=A0A024U7R8_9STRA|nr:hypothetical protein, variant [Aphanomyces invadans]ETW02270.1 hypothetical protein, variant [Aphanomyces invadans]|eukprot:XP_008868875.1 hypothetical protein, variant [Aphanomyces invadans]
MTSPSPDTSISGLLSRMTSFRFTLSESDGSQSASQARPPQIKRELHMKVAIVGGNGVGKSSIVRRWLKRPYQSAYHPTIGVDVHTIKYSKRGASKDSPIYVDVWDVSCAEVNSPAFHELLCTGLDGIFFVFNVHRVSSIAAVDAWQTALGKFISSSEIPFYLLSHKADMLQKRVMTSDDIDAYVRTAGFKGWSWTVGRAGLGESDKNPAVLEALDTMIDLICRGKSADEMLRDRYSQSTSISSRGDGILQPIHPIEVAIPSAAGTLSFVHVPTQAITTIPRDVADDVPSRANAAGGFGAAWMFGDQKGQYLVVHSRESMDMVDSSDGEALSDVGSDRGSTASSHETTTTLHSPVEDDGWRFFAGSLDRAKTERLLSTHGEGAFLVRRKDARTLVLSYQGNHDDAHHVLLAFQDGNFYVGGAPSSSRQPSTAPPLPAFSTLSKCLRSLRKYAFRGLTFHRTPSKFQFGRPSTMDVVVAPPTGQRRSDVAAPPSSWTPDANAPQAHMQAPQTPVDVPPLQRLGDMMSQFYSQVRQRLDDFERLGTTGMTCNHGEISFPSPL